MLTFRSSFGLVVVNDKLYAIGGQHGNAKNEVYTPFSSYPKSTPTPTLSPTPIPSSGPDPTPTPFPEPESFPTTIAIASIGIIAVIGIGILVYFKKYWK